MKKFFLSLVCLICLITGNVKAVELPAKSNHEKVTIYIFRGHGCSHCYEALEYFYDNKEQYADYFEIKAYEVWENADNNKLMEAVKEYRKDDGKGVPYIVIGENYSVNGFGESLIEEIMSTAVFEYQNEDYKDIVKEVVKDHSKAKVENLEEACKAEGIIGGKYDALIIGIILIVVIGSGAAFVYFSKK